MASVLYMYKTIGNTELTIMLCREWYKLYDVQTVINVSIARQCLKKKKNRSGVQC